MKKLIILVVAILFFISASIGFAQQIGDSPRSYPRLEKKAETSTSSEKKRIEKQKKKLRKAKTNKTNKKTKKNAKNKKRIKNQTNKNKK